MSSTFSTHFLFILANMFVVQLMAVAGRVSDQSGSGLENGGRRLWPWNRGPAKDDCWAKCGNKSGICKFCINSFGINSAFCCRTNDESKKAVGCNGHNGGSSYNKCTPGADVATTISTDATADATTDATNTGANNDDADVVSGSETGFRNALMRGASAFFGGLSGNNNGYHQQTTPPPRDSCLDKCNNKGGVCEYCVNNAGLSRAFCCRVGLDYAEGVVGCSGDNGGDYYHRCVRGEKKPTLSSTSSSSSDSSSFFNKVGMSGGVLLFVIGGTAGIAGVGFKLFTKKRNDGYENVLLDSELDSEA